MGGEWCDSIIGDICSKVMTGGTPLTKHKEYYDDGLIPWLKTKEVNFCRVAGTENHISALGLENSSAKLIPENSVIVAMYGQGDTAGRVAINKIPLCTNQACCNLVIDPKLADYQFVYFYLKNSYSELVRRKTGSAQPNLNTQIIKDFEISLPPLVEQKAIAHILGSLDDKIELNRQMNETLEAMAQALFKSWFVDFDPVIDNALAAGNDIPEALASKAAARQALGDARRPLPEDIRQHFPNSFEFTEEMGWVPEGWEAKQLSTLIKIKHGFAFKGEYFSKEPTNDVLLTPGNFLIGGGFKSDKFKYYNGPVPEDYILSEKDLLVTMTDLSKAGDTLGYPLRVPISENVRYLHNQRLGKVESLDDSLGNEFLYRCFCSESYRDEILSSVSGSTVKHTSPTKILVHTIPLSNNGIERVFENYSRAFTERKHENLSNNVVLRKLRDTLLPKLLSGELRIPDAEKLVEKAL